MLSSKRYKDSRINPHITGLRIIGSTAAQPSLIGSGTPQTRWCNLAGQYSESTQDVQSKFHPDGSTAIAFYWERKCHQVTFSRLLGVSHKQQIMFHSLFIWNSSVTGCPVFYLASLPPPLCVSMFGMQKRTFPTPCWSCNFCKCKVQDGYLGVYTMISMASYLKEPQRGFVLLFQRESSLLGGAGSHQSSMPPRLSGFTSAVTHGDNNNCILLFLSTCLQIARNWNWQACLIGSHWGWRYNSIFEIWLRSG